MAIGAKQIASFTSPIKSSRVSQPSLGPGVERALDRGICSGRTSCRKLKRLEARPIVLAAYVDIQFNEFRLLFLGYHTCQRYCKNSSFETCSHCGNFRYYGSHARALMLANRICDLNLEPSLPG